LRRGRRLSARGERTSRRFIEFFTASIRNRKGARGGSCSTGAISTAWSCTRSKLSWSRPISSNSAPRLSPTVKQDLAAIRQLFDYLTTGAILEVKPAASARGPEYAVKRGKTPVLSADEARKLLDLI
jgi:hypothetical protein